MGKHAIAPWLARAGWAVAGIVTIATGAYFASLLWS
jgi:hypothetical protein